MREAYLDVEKARNGDVFLNANAAETHRHTVHACRSRIFTGSELGSSQHLKRSGIYSFDVEGRRLHV